MTAANAPARPTRAVPPHALRRGTRGLAAFGLFLIALAVLAVAVVVLPSTTLSRLALSWLIPLTLAFGIAHLVAVYGVLRRRAWVVSLTLYLASVGIGVAVYGLLATVTGADPFAPAGGLPAADARANGLGFLVWMIGLWVVAARFTVRGMAAPLQRPIVEASPEPIATSLAPRASGRPRVGLARS
jgi:hypothetical protein